MVSSSFKFSILVGADNTHSSCSNINARSIFFVGLLTTSSREGKELASLKGEMPDEVRRGGERLEVERGRTVVEPVGVGRGAIRMWGGVMETEDAAQIDRKLVGRVEG